MDLAPVLALELLLVLVQVPVLVQIPVQTIIHMVLVIPIRVNTTKHPILTAGHVEPRILLIANQMVVDCEANFLHPR